jgi:cobalamin biosynthesis protein CobT
MRRTNGIHKIELALVAALGVLAILALPSIASAKAGDRNHDGIPDRWEKHFHLSLRVNQATRNQDHEGLDNLAEFQAGTNPRNPNSNGNGVPDGQINAGTIASFDGTTLTINLNDGHTLSGQVTGSTEIECSQGESQEGSEGEQGDSEDEQGDSGDQSDDQSRPSQVQSQDQGGQSGDQGQSGDSQDQSDDEQGEGEGTCTTAALVPGAIVHEADLEAGPSGEVFRSVHLAG